MTIKNAEVDRISNLPDTVLSHIISSLPTKNAVATSILSKRWKYLWTNISNLDFELRPSFPSIYRDYVHETIRFMNFVDRVLHLCTSAQIQKFRLHYCEKLESPRVNAWLNEAIKRNVRELDLIVAELPQFIFTCKTLTVLKLHKFDIPASFCLPNLKILHVNLYLPSNDLTEKLFSSCPVLEDLVIAGKLEDYEEYNFNIFHPALKKLKISFSVGCDVPIRRKFVFNAPNLRYLDLFNNFLANYMVENLSSVMEAKVDVGGGSAVELLKGLGSVKSLSLHMETISALDFIGSESLPTFYDLNCLELINYSRATKVLLGLLERSPNLETLILDKMGYYCSRDEFDWREPQSVPICLLSHLKVIKIIRFGEKAYKLKLVKYLLRNAEVLETLIIDPIRSSLEQEAKICNELLEFPRGSRTCRIRFVGRP